MKERDRERESKQESKRERGVGGRQRQAENKLVIWENRSCKTKVVKKRKICFILVTAQNLLFSCAVKMQSRLSSVSKFRSDKCK